jgi:hypothetical protein
MNNGNDKWKEESDFSLSRQVSRQFPFTLDIIMPSFQYIQFEIVLLQELKWTETDFTLCVERRL